MPMFRISVRLYCWVEHIKNWEPRWTEISSKGCYIEKPDNPNRKLNNINDELIINIQNAQLHESWLITKFITKFQIGYGGFRNPNGSSYIDLPLWIEHKKACVNIQNDDSKCFMYAVQCGVYEIYKKQQKENHIMIMLDSKKKHQQWNMPI